jgi:cytochrome c oxidase subunit 2
MKKFTLSALVFFALTTIVSFRSLLSAQSTPERVEVTATKFAFAPAEITVKKGHPVTLVMKSADVAHGLRFRELNVDIKSGKGQSGEATFTPDKTGDFVGHCSVFCGSGHGSMTLTLHVVD